MNIPARWLYIAAVVFIVVGVGLNHIVEGVLVAWRLDVIRIDLDDIADFMLGFGGLLVGVAAYKRASQAHKKAEENGNGTHVLEQKEELDVASLHERIRRLEEG